MTKRKHPVKQLTGIQFRLLLLGIGPALFLAAILAVYYVQSRVNDLEQSLQNRGFVIVHQLAIASVYGISSGKREILQNITDTLLLEKDIASVKIIDLQGDVMAFAQLIPQPAKQQLIVFNAPVLLHPTQESIEDQTYQLALPGKGISGETIGHVEVTLSLENTLIIKQSILINSITLTVIGLLVTALLANHLGSGISKPVLSLTKAVNEISQGNMSARANFTADSEFEDLRQGFNLMATGMQKNQQYLQQQIVNATENLSVTLKALEQKNISLEQAKELAVAQNEIKSQFLAHISHEIRTPMNSIIGFSDLLSKTELSIQQTEYVQLVRSSANNLLSIVNEILDYSSLESGKFKINIKPFDLYGNLEDTVSFLNSQSDKVSIILDVAANFPEKISTDPIRFQQVVTNLLGNAIKFTQHGHIILRCCLAENYLLLTVSDTGSGIPEHHRQQLFSPFLQLSEFAINSERGTGLGLTISKNIVERLNGTIGVFSKEHVGSTFWFNIPVSIEQPFLGRTKPVSIGIIESFALRRHAFSKQLTRLGYQVQCFKSDTDFFPYQADALDIIFLGISPLSNITVNITKTLNKIKAKTQTPVILLKTNHQHPEKYFQEPSLLLPSSSKFLSAFIDSILQRNQQHSHFMSQPQLPNDYSILIADDNEINRLLLKSQLENCCSNITLVNNGKDALELLQSKPFDLILLDLQMPELSGIDIIRLIKKPDNINCNTPSISITAHARPEQRQLIIEAGFDECLIKPVVAEQLHELIDLWLPQQKRHKINNFSAANYIEMMLEKTQGNKELAGILFNKLFDELPQQIGEISKAFERKDIALANEITHIVHGSVSFCGLNDMQQPAKFVELLLTENDLPNAYRYFNELEFYVENFIKQQQQITTVLEQQ